MHRSSHDDGKSGVGPCVCVGAPCARCEPREPCEPCELELGLRRVGQPCHQAARDNLTLHHNSKLHMHMKPVSRRRDRHRSPLCHASSPTFGHGTAGRCHHETLVPPFLLPDLAAEPCSLLFAMWLPARRCRPESRVACAKCSHFVPCHRRH